MESILFPGHYIEDPGQNDVSNFKLTAVDNIYAAAEKFYFNMVKKGWIDSITYNNMFVKTIEIYNNSFWLTRIISISINLVLYHITD